MTKKVYPFTALTGGGSGALDAMASINNGSPLQNLDVAYVTTATEFYPYSYNLTSEEAEDSPLIIKGDDEGGAGRFKLVEGHFHNIKSYGNAIAVSNGSINGELSVGATLTISTIDGTNSLVTTTCGQGVKRTALGAADYNPSALTTDYLIVADNTAAARAVTISTEDEDSGSTANPRVFVIKDESGGAAAHNITISLESGGNIDGVSSYVMDQPYQSVMLYLDGTNGFII